MHAFQQLLENVTRVDDGRFQVSIDASWTQGRTAFGGLSAALIVRAMLGDIEPSRRLRALSVNFVGPVTVGLLQIELRRLREGGSVTHVQGDLWADGQLAVTATATFARDRPSSAQVALPTPPSLPGPDGLEPFPYIKGVTPEFTRHFEMRMAQGALPMSGADAADTALWVRFCDPLPLSPPVLVALGDIPPIPGLNMVRAPAAGSSMSWYLEFAQEIKDARPDDWWLFDYRCQGGGAGYFHNTATIWAPDGRCALFSRQLAAVFEKSP